jgi:hypothetical protein
MREAWEILTAGPEDAERSVLLALGLLVLTAPRSIPGLTTPGDAPMQQMGPSGS